jgi:hypothetical protein
MAKFDALMADYSKTPPYTAIHLGTGLFRTAATHSWYVRPGWVVDGAGMYLTTVQMGGNVSAYSGVSCLASDPNISTDYATISDLTVDCNWAELSTTAPAGAGGEKNITVSAVGLCGSNNLVDHVRCINSYGSAANHREQFTIFLTGSRFGDGTNNVIQYCRAELPQGDHDAPFALAGWIFSAPTHLITNSKVIGCTAVGVNNRKQTGFTSGGVNLANVKDCQINSNTFIDCFGAAYSDTGSIDGLQVNNNTVTRGWQGVGLANSGLPKQNVTISGNNFQIQNRNPDGTSYGIVTGSGVTTNVTVTHNTISFDASGTGISQFGGVAVSRLNTATISDNTIGFVSAYMYNYATGIGITMFNNLDPNGNHVPGL